MGILTGCQRHRVKELLLVMGGVKSMEREPDIAFVRSSQRPWPTYLRMNEEHDLENRTLQILRGAGYDTWKHLEGSMGQKLKDFKE